MDLNIVWYQMPVTSYYGL